MFWMTAKKDGNCAECNDDLEVGQRIVWDSEKFDAFCGPCSPIGADPQDEGSVEHARKRQNESSSKDRSKKASKKKKENRK